MHHAKQEALVKCDQVLSIISVSEGLTKNDDNVIAEIRAANLLMRGLLIDIKERLESEG